MYYIVHLAIKGNSLDLCEWRILETVFLYSLITHIHPHNIAVLLITCL